MYLFFLTRAKSLKITAARVHCFALNPIFRNIRYQKPFTGSWCAPSLQEHIEYCGCCLHETHSYSGTISVPFERPKHLHRMKLKTGRKQRMEAPKQHQTNTMLSPLYDWASSQSMAGSVIFVQLLACKGQLAKYMVHAHWYTPDVEFQLDFQQGVTSPISGVAGKPGIVLQLTPPRATDWSKKLSPESILQVSVSLIHDIHGLFFGPTWANHT